MYHNINYKRSNFIWNSGISIKIAEQTWKSFPSYLNVGRDKHILTVIAA